MANTLAEARAAVHAAAMVKENLICRSLEGEPVTDAEMLEADRACDRAERALQMLITEVMDVE